MAIALDVSNHETPGQNNHYLNAWQRIMMENIWHYNQVQGQGAPLATGNKQAGSVYLQSEREMVARAMETAATRMALELNYWPSPAWFQEEIPLGQGLPFRNQTHRVRWQKLIELGSRATAVIQAGVSVTYTDPSHTGIDDLATITLTSTIAASEIKVYFTAADSSADAGDYRYEIEPVTVSKSGNTVTITGHRALFVKPIFWQHEFDTSDPNFNSPNAAETGDPNDFVTTVDIYRVYTDTTAHMQMVSGDGTVLATWTGEILDKQIGEIRLGGDGCVDWSSCKWPNRLIVNYKSGSPLVNGNIDGELLRGMVGFANCRMLGKLKDMSYWTLDQWQQDTGALLAGSGANTVSLLSPADAKNPFGLRAGEVNAWRVCMDRRVEAGLKLTRTVW